MEKLQHPEVQARLSTPMAGKQGNSFDIEEIYKDIFNVNQSRESWDDDESDSDWSTSESGISNSFLDDAFNGHYDGWDRKHDAYAGRWSTVEKLCALVNHVQQISFDQASSVEVCKQTKGKLMNFLRRAQLDIVEQEVRFPDKGSFCFIDGPEWTAVIGDLFDVLNDVRTSLTCAESTNRTWQKVVGRALRLLSECCNRSTFEKANNLSWVNATIDYSVEEDDL